MIVVDSSLGSLNPAIYSYDSVEGVNETCYPDEHLGRIWFTLAYENQHEKLTIGITKIKNLPTRCSGGTYCDPYVR